MSLHRSIAITLGLALALVVGLGGSLGAHTDVWQRSPAAGQAFGGVVDEVQISFVAAVGSSNISVIGPDGESLEISPTRLESADRIAVAEFPALTEAGAYVVTHRELAADGDVQTDAFQFFFDPTSENAVVPLLGQDGPNWPLLGVLAGVVLILVGVFWPGRTKTPSRT